MTAAHDGMKFSTPLMDYDLMVTVNCAEVFGGGWWFTRCAIWCPTTVSPMWFSVGDATYHLIEKVRMMIKPQ